MARVFVDTNVLFPFSIMDMMLTLAEDGIHELLWTEALLAEWERVIVREHGRSAESAGTITTTIREYFPEGRVAEQDYVNLIGSMPGKDPDDRRHMAAALAGQADDIVTWNRSDFPAVELARLGIRVIDPDEYLSELITSLPDEMLQVVIRMAARKKRPPMTPLDLIERLEKAGIPNCADRLRDLQTTEQPQ